MALQVYPPIVVVRNLIGGFFRYRGLALAPRGLSREAALRAFSDDEVIGDMEQFSYVRLDAKRIGPPRGGRDWVVVLVLSANGKYARHGPDLRLLLNGVEAERATKEGRLDELIVVAEEDFFRKKNLTDVVRELQGKQAGGDDRLGTAPFYSAHPYHNFALVVPEHRSVFPHRLMEPAEVDALLRRELLARSDLPVVYASDPPIVWNGGREGQVVEITRASQTAAEAIYYRRIENGA
jgi:DNA-directed RNA polymerase subunit H (RpoH/RPB5)